LTGSSEDSEDILADAFIRLIRALQHKTMSIVNVRAYLFRVVHNRAVDDFRRRKRLEQDVDISQIICEPGSGSIERDVLAMKQVRSALWQLTDQQRQVIMLRYYQGLSYQEIGSVLDKPAGAVKALQHRGLEALRRIFQKEDDGRESHGD
jgi:RNA polymerase sigma-70 factor, ECF subfamily